jgi:hypothetical protein
VVRARLDGSLRLKHKFYSGRDDDNYADATVLGYLDFRADSRAIQTLRLVTDRATYGKMSFTVAVRSLP